MKKIVALLSICLLSNIAQADLIEFDFSFVNSGSNGGGTVTGIIRGLSEGTGAASSVEITGNTGGFGLGEYVLGSTYNTWTVAEGLLTSFDFLSFGVYNGLDSSIRLTTRTEGIWSGLSQRTNSVSHPFSNFSATARAVSVPEPGTLLLFGMGLLGLGIARRKAA